MSSNFSTCLYIVYIVMSSQFGQIFNVGARKARLKVGFVVSYNEYFNGAFLLLYTVNHATIRQYYAIIGQLMYVNTVNHALLYGSFQAHKRRFSHKNMVFSS